MKYLFGIGLVIWFAITGISLLAFANPQAAQVYTDQGGQTMHIGTSSTLEVESGADVHIKSGGDLEVLSGATASVESGGTLDIEDGGSFTIDGDAALAFTDVSIPSATVKALNATAYELVPAPGAGKVVFPKRVVFWLDYNSVAYNGIAAGEDLAIKWTSSGGTQIMGSLETTGFLDQTSDQQRIVYYVDDVSHSAGLSPAANAPLMLHMLTGEIATGDSPLKVRTYYEVLPTTW